MYCCGTDLLVIKGKSKGAKSRFRKANIFVYSTNMESRAILLRRISPVVVGGSADRVYLRPAARTGKSTLHVWVMLLGMEAAVRMSQGEWEVAE